MAASMTDGRMGKHLVTITSWEKFNIMYLRRKEA